MGVGDAGLGRVGMLGMGQGFEAVLHNLVVKALPRPCSWLSELLYKGNVLFSISLSSERTGLWKRGLRDVS